MNTGSGLLPHEAFCQVCHGYTPSGTGGYCDTCDGTGVIASERRDHERLNIADDFTRLRNERNAALAELDENRELLRVAMQVLEGYRDWIQDIADRNEKPGN